MSSYLYKEPEIVQFAEAGNRMVIEKQSRAMGEGENEELSVKGHKVHYTK